MRWERTRKIHSRETPPGVSTPTCAGAREDLEQVHEQSASDQAYEAVDFEAEDEAAADMIEKMLAEATRPASECVCVCVCGPSSW